jgi:cytochrome c oxidase subunit 1
MTSSPPPEHNFDEVPTVTHLDEFWTRKYGTDEDGRTVRIAATEDVVQKGDAVGVHLPSPSYWPVVVALGLPLIAYGLIFNLAWAVPGVILLIGGIYGWAMEPPDNDEVPPHDHYHDHDGDGDGAEALSDGDGPAAELEAATAGDGAGEGSDG